ncbi:MAG: hypothetical protein A2252_11715 [Elusimicrobia bacterium RIFOXYA2_FULL_39_19]|nr:MAG: hypothetical protein A2252_11715 [Elusimicrobia bacterium RIFOXYA2_FULL_39_19]
MLKGYDKQLERISAWWQGKIIDRACIDFRIIKQEQPRSVANACWISPEQEPDMEKMVDCFIKQTKATQHYGEALPVLHHLFGNRGTPMTIAGYLGGEMEFGESTTWYKHKIDNWDEFKIEFDPENIWWKRSKKLFEITIEKAKQNNCIPSFPDYGDIFTIFSVLRGSQELVFDVIDNKETIIKARDRLLKFRNKYHQEQYSLYSKYFHGDNTWLMWAPGKTEAIQCDFSVLISPPLFEELVIPEIEQMGRYYDYLVWHLDGPDEIKFLDRLLEIPQIKAIQWQQGAGKPSPSNWLPMLKKIQEHKRSIIVYPKDENEIKILLQELSPEGLFISGGFTGKTDQEAQALIKMVEKLSVKK